MSTRTPVYRLKLIEERVVNLPPIRHDDPVEALAIFFHKLIGRADKEHLTALFFSRHGHATGVSTISIGSFAETSVRAREVFTPALVSCASSLILCHNHPSGAAEPSLADLVATKRLVEMGDLLEIEVRDHLIITAHGAFTSLRTTGAMPAARIGGRARPRSALN